MVYVNPQEFAHVGVFTAYNPLKSSTSFCEDFWNIFSFSSGKLLSWMDQSLSFDEIKLFFLLPSRRKVSVAGIHPPSLSTVSESSLPRLNWSVSLWFLLQLGQRSGCVHTRASKIRQRDTKTVLWRKLKRAQLKEKHTVFWAHNIY